MLGLRQEMVLTKKQSLVSHAICGGLFQHDLDGGHLRVLADDARGKLIGGGTELHFHAGLGAIIGVNAGEPDGRCARMIADAVAERVGLQVSQVAHNQQVIRAPARAASGSASAHSRHPARWESIDPE